ncbi:MAG: 50S ribosomal protein L28 [Phycisphaerae bacterium]|nr:50S ribosomal protein L28 [Phycisphaerae bacterium]
MPRQCHFTGARTSFGNSIRTRGRAKYLGGVGTKITACTRRKFKPNLQTVTALVDGVPKRIKVSTKAIRQGLVVKPMRRAATRAK